MGKAEFVKKLEEEENQKGQAAYGVKARIK